MRPLVPQSGVVCSTMSMRAMPPMALMAPIKSAEPLPRYLSAVTALLLFMLVPLMYPVWRYSEPCLYRCLLAIKCTAAVVWHRPANKPKKECAVLQGKCAFLFVSSASDKQWPKGEKHLRQALESFRV